MTADEVERGQKVRVVWKRFRYPRNATVLRVMPPQLATVQYRDGDVAVVNVAQLTLRSGVKS